jgi:hypothetical protein
LELADICKYDGKRVVRLLSLSGMVGRISINAHMAPRMVKIKITNGSPEEKRSENYLFCFNNLRISCGGTLVVGFVVVIPVLVRLGGLFTSSSKFCSNDLYDDILQVISRLPRRSSGFRRSKYCIRILCTTF